MSRIGSNRSQKVSAACSRDLGADLTLADFLADFLASLLRFVSDFKPDFAALVSAKCHTSGVLFLLRAQERFFTPLKSLPRSPDFGLRFRQIHIRYCFHDPP